MTFFNHSLEAKKSVIFILPDLDTGGAERIVTTLANHLPRETFETKVMLLRKEGGYLDFLSKDVEVIDLKTPRIRNSVPPILREIRRRKPDIVFTGFGEVNAFLSPFVPMFRKTKFIARETNVVSRHVTRKEIKFFYRFYNNFSKIVCQSDDMAGDLSSNFSIGANKIIKINNPVDFDFINGQADHSEIPKLYRKDYKNVVAVGNLSARKGFDNLLQVFTLLKDKPILLHILGAGRDEELLRKIKSDKGLQNVIFHGKQKNPYQFLKFADLFVLSSRYEGFPNVLLEAGACGTYSLANNCPGGIDEIIQPGINGEIFDIENHSGFAEKMLTILNEEHDSAAIKDSIRNRFSKEMILKKYEDLLLSV